MLKFNLLEYVISICCELWLTVEMVGMLYIYMLSYKNVCIHFFVVVASFRMVFWEYKIGFFSATEETDVVVNSIADYVWCYEGELTGFLSENVDSWYWLYF